MTVVLKTTLVFFERLSNLTEFLTVHMADLAADKQNWQFEDLYIDVLL